MPNTYPKRRRGISYFAEFIIIISGIMVSFLLNEWRTEHKAAKQKVQLTREINKDLFSDSLLLEQSILFYEKTIKAHDSLLINRDKEFNADSLDLFLDLWVSYFPFKETSTTYEKILNLQDISVEQEDSLIELYMGLHKQIYPNLHEWLFIEKDFVIKRALPYMDTNAPFVYPTSGGKAFDGSVFYELKKKDAFLNMIKSGRLYKQSMLRISKGVLLYVKFLKAKVNTQLQQQEIEDKE